MTNYVNTFLLALGLSLALPALADDMGNMDTSASVAKTAHGVGVIKAIDITAGTVTLSHQAIKELHWPAMTMGFKLARPELLNGLAVGSKVRFELQGAGKNQVVTAISVNN